MQLLGKDLQEFVHLFETNKKPDFELYVRRVFITDDCVWRANLSFVRLLDVPCRVDELIPEWLNLPTRSSRCLRVMLDLPSGFMWSLRYRERPDQMVLPFIYDCYVQLWEIHMARCRAHRHTAVQTSVAEGFLAFVATIRMARSRWSDEHKLSPGLSLLTFHG